MVKGFAKKFKSLNFLGMLYTLKSMLPLLTALKLFNLEPSIFQKLFQVNSNQKLNSSNFLTKVKPLIC